MFLFGFFDFFFDAITVASVAVAVGSTCAFHLREEKRI